MEKKDDQDYPVETCVSPFSCEVEKVLISDGMHVKKGQTMLIMTPTPSNYIPVPLSDESEKSRIKKVLDDHSYLMPESSLFVDKQLEANAAAKDTGGSSSNRMVTIPDDVMKRYETFKKFDIVVDHSDHLFSAYTCEMKHPAWTNTIKQEWEILEQYLPDTIFVRAYESRMDLLRAVIVGRAGTPYQNGLFFLDVFFPNKYPYIPPLVRYHSGGLVINPNLSKRGELCLILLNAVWVPVKNVCTLLLFIQDLIFKPRPYFMGPKSTTERGPVSEECYSFLYNENTIVNSLKTMVFTMNKPPKNFEDFVVGHFRMHVRDILMPCIAYMEGLQVGCLVSDVDMTCSTEFKNDVSLCIKSLLDAFNKIGAKEAQDFVSLVRKRKVFIDQDINNSVKKKRMDYELCHGLDHNNSGSCSSWSWNVSASQDCFVTKVLVKDGMKVEREQPLYAEDVTCITDVWQIYVHGSHVTAGIPNEDVLDRYKNFKKVDFVVDHSDHLFSEQNFPMNQQPKDWADVIKEEWRILEEQLPETIFVRAYESRMDLLRAVIIGPKGTPYHGGLFFFDVCFPSNYPDSPPLINYYSRGVGINPNMYERGTVCLSLPKTNGGLEPMWSPGSSTMLQLLVSIQNDILNAQPLFNDPAYALMKGTQYGDQASFQYNEMTLTKLLETMIYTLIQPPKNFEDFVVGHFYNHGRDILMTICNKNPCSVKFMNELATIMGPVAAAFAEIGIFAQTQVTLRLLKNEVILELTKGTICPNTPFFRATQSVSQLNLNKHSSRGGSSVFVAR